MSEQSIPPLPVDFRDIRDQLELLIGDTSADGPRWTSVLHGIQRALDRARSMTECRFSSSTIDVGSMWAMCLQLLDALLTCSCEDREVALRLTLVFARYQKKQGLWRYWQDKDRMSVVYMNQYFQLVYEKYVNKMVVYVLSPASFTRLGPWDSDEHACADDPVTLGQSVRRALKDCNWKFLSVLLKYGFWDGSLDVEDSEKSIWSYINNNHDWRHTLCPEVQPQLLGYNYGRLSVDKVRERPRIRYIVWALKAATVLRPPHRDSYLRCLRLCFAAVPDPVVTASEVKGFLLYLSNDHDGPLLDKLVDQYASVFGRHPLGPRRLEHLSRYAAKSRLVAVSRSSSVALPKLVKDLPLPETMKDFILGAPEKWW